MTTISTVNPVDVDLDITKVKVSSNDTTPGYLEDKLADSTDIDFTVSNEGGNETITASLKPTAVTPNTYTTATITVDSKGRITSAASGIGTEPAGGDLGGTYPNPEVAAITTTAGPTSLTIGAIADGEFLKRSGATIISAPVAPLGAAGGDLGGTYPNPEVAAITETSGPTSLVIGAVADGEFLKRNGATIISSPVVSAGAASGDLGGTYPNPEVAAITTTAGPTSLTIGAIADGEFLKRSGATLISGAASATAAATATNIAETRSGFAEYEAILDADDDKIVVSAPVADGVLALAAQPDYPRLLTVTVTTDASQITAGTITLVGVGASGQAVSAGISLVLGPNTSNVVTTTVAFATVTSATIAGYVGGGGDTIKVGTALAVAVPASYSPTPSNITFYKVVKSNANDPVASYTTNSTAGTIYPTVGGSWGGLDYCFAYTYQVTPTQNSHSH